METMQFTSHQDIFKRLANVGNLAALTPEERYQYEYDLKKARDYHAELSYAKKIAMREGREEGMKEGIKEGIKEGRKEGMKEGERKAMMAIAQRMASSGMPIEKISEFTGIPIQALRR